MWSLKTSRGITRGRGFREQQRLMWLLSMLACAETNRAIQELTGVKSNSGEQNKDMSKLRPDKSGLRRTHLSSSQPLQTGILFQPTLTSETSWRVWKLTMLLIFIVLELLERWCCPQWQGNQRQTTRSSVVPRPLPLLQSRLKAGMKATLCR